MSRSALVLALSLVTACAEPVPVSPRLPQHLAETGLYADFTRREIAPDVLAFVPQYPLWTDGAAKQRWIWLPAGTAIDASDPDAWQFPIGTRLWKEFAYDRPVETRYMELGADGWSYATYVWSPDGSTADLASEFGVPAAWRGDGHAHDVPSRFDCRACHEGGGGAVLGFSALQLSTDRDPLAPHATVPGDGDVDLATLRARGLVRDLSDTAPRIAARTPRERAVLGYLHGNCGSCHNAQGGLAELGMVLQWRSDRDVAGPLATALGQPSRFRTPECGDSPLRICAGDPEHSVLARRAGSRDPSTQMPPIGTHVIDGEALELIAAWIRTDLAADQELPRRMKP